MADRRDAERASQFTARISTACDKLAVITDAGKLAQLVRYLELLQDWTGANWPNWPVQPLERHLVATKTPRVLDVGSGGGLPGAVLAIVSPRLDVVCLDAVGKKSAFVAQVAAELSLPNLASAHSRVQDFRGGPFDIVISRAYGSLRHFVESSLPLLSASGVWAAMKGKASTAELANLPCTAQMFHVEQLVVPDLPAERCLVWMRSLP